MSLIKIPDGIRTAIYFESFDIVAVRSAEKNKTYIFIRGDEDPWKVDCGIDEVLSLIPKRIQIP